MALRYERFDILKDSKIEFQNSKELMSYAVKSPKIFDFLEKQYKRLPISFGLIGALNRDRVRMFQGLYERIGPEVMLLLIQEKGKNSNNFSEDLNISSIEAYLAFNKVKDDLIFYYERVEFDKHISDEIKLMKFNSEY